MIENTFLHIPGIGMKTEQRLWEAGIHCWDDFTPSRPVKLSPSRMDGINAALTESRRNLASGDPKYFAEALPANQHWRLFPEFRGSTAYLDIETTGLSPWDSEITTIALYDGESVHHFVSGRNLGDFPGKIDKYKVLVTYNGKTFDVPFIEHYFGITLAHAHIDLRYVLAALGYRGGLKGCEHQLGIGRGDLADLDGYFAVLLWYDYVRNENEKALETLLAYNIQDTVNLETLMVIAYNRRVAEVPLDVSRIPEPDAPAVPFHADMETIRRIRMEHGILS